MANEYESYDYMHENTVRMHAADMIASALADLDIPSGLDRSDLAPLTEAIKAAGSEVAGAIRELAKAIRSTQP